MAIYRVSADWQTFSGQMPRKPLIFLDRVGNQLREVISKDLCKGGPVENWKESMNAQLSERPPELAELESRQERLAIESELRPIEETDVHLIAAD